MSNFQQNTLIRNYWKTRRDEVCNFRFALSLLIGPRGAKSGKTIDLGHLCTPPQIAIAMQAIKSSFSKIWMPPDFASSIRTGCQHLSCIRWMLLCPSDDLVVNFGGRIGLEGFCLWIVLRTCLAGNCTLTSNRSHAHTVPCSSPHTTEASP